MIVSGSAMAALGDFRSAGEVPREGQLICPQIAESARKRETQEARVIEQDKSREVASNSVSGH